MSRAFLRLVPNMMALALMYLGVSVLAQEPSPDNTYSNHVLFAAPLLLLAGALLAFVGWDTWQDRRSR